MAKYTHLIPQNIAPESAEKITVYNPYGKLVGTIPLNGLAPSDLGEKLYSFGCLSDVHVTYETASEDFQRALTFFNEVGVDFICICGDLAHAGTAYELQQYKNIVTAYSDGLPVYVAIGNHEQYASTSSSYLSFFTGKPLYYTVERGDDVFIMFGVVSGEQGSLFEAGALQWLYETLEQNRNKRCFLFEHILLDDGCGDILDLYGYSKLTSDNTEGAVFKSLLSHYHNVIFFHGHSHMRFYLQERGAMANYDYAYGCHSVHIPSCAVPRDINAAEDGLDTYYAGSEGYVVDVYENGIHLRGRDFIKGVFLPIASYWLDTVLQTIKAKTYVDETGTIDTTPIKTTDMLVSETGADLIENWNLTPNSSNGQKNTSYFTFKYIPVEPGETYYSQYGTRSWFLDADKNPVKTLNLSTKSGTGSNVQYQFVVPDGVAYISISYSYAGAGSPDNVYIRKAPHYAVIFEETTVTLETGGYAELSGFPECEYDQAYVLVVNGVKYKTIGADPDGLMALCIGYPGTTDPDDCPLYIDQYGADLSFINAVQSGTYTFSILKEV